MNLIINPMGISVINKHIRKDDNLFCRFNEIKKTVFKHLIVNP